MQSQTDGPGSGERAPDPDDVFQLVALPLLAGLKDETTADSAAWALVLLAQGCPDLVSDLADRLRAQCRNDGSGAAVRTLAHLESQYPGRVRSALAGADGGLQVRVVEGNGWSFDSRVRADGGPQATVREASDVATGLLDAERLSTETTDSKGTDRRVGGQEPGHDWNGLLSAVELSSQIEGVSVIESPTDGRFGTTLRARATVEGADRGIAIRVFDHGSAGRQFERALMDRLDAWQAVGDRSGVATVHGFGSRPRPWVATDYIDGTLAAVEMTSDRHVLTLARSVATVHERGVVHGGLDPWAIRLSGGELDGSSTPKLDWVGLLAVFREHGVTGSFLDPRFAAPEHFESDRGGIDQATDVYGLGAIVYWLATGRPPFEGSTDEIQQAVLTSSPIPPSDVRPGLPGGIDDVIEKAMATEKITRYESARQLLADLRRIA